MKKRRFATSSTRGFTILEAMIATVIIATLTAIAAPNWTNFVNQQRLKGANEEIDTALRLAQSRARRENQAYSVQFRGGSIPQMATFRAGQTPNWVNITNRADFIDLSLTQGDTVIFNYDGSIGVSSPIRPNEKVTLTLTGVSSNSPQQCVIVQTILGAMVRQKGANCNQT